MNNLKIDNALIYEILKFINNSPNGTTTLRDIVDNTSLGEYASGNTAISEIMNMGLLAARSKNGIITVTLDSRGNGKLFIDNYRFVSHLTSKEKWKERVWGFISGIFVGVIVSFIVFYLGIA